jgi:hypothetical protein
MTRIALALVLLGAGLVAPAGEAARVSQSDPASVWVAASVTASDGRVIRGLTADQFIVEVDERPAPVVECVEGPTAAVGLLVDASGSMFGLSTGEVREIARNLPALLRPGDTASLSWFGRTIATGSFGRDWSVFEPIVRRFEDERKAFFSPSPLWDAMNTTLGTLARQPQRRVLIVWTDGRVTGNLIPFDVVMRHALNAGVTTSFLVPGMPDPNVPPKRSLPRPSGRRGTLSEDEIVVIRPWERPRLIADATGGIAVGFTGVRETPKSRIERLITGLKTDYLIRVRVESSDGRLHPIDVRVKAPELTVRAPASVFIAPATPDPQHGVH